LKKKISKAFFALELLYLIFPFVSCKNETPIVTPAYEIISGKTMGTTYTIQHDLKSISLENEVDSILHAINQSVSTYVENSTISKINKGKDCTEINVLVQSQISSQCLIEFQDDIHFLKNFNASFSIYNITDGYFDPTIMPLVNYWGFGYDPKKAVTKVDSLKVNELQKRLGFDKWTLSQNREALKIIKPQVAELDFSAIAKGYAVDYLSQFLLDKGSQNFIVEIGGEVFAKGVNAHGKPWTIGLNEPKENASINDFSAFVNLDDLGLASSGNYRNFYTVNGKKYGHEINPLTGYPELNKLLGVSVISTSCMEADAYATAFMVMGLEKSKEKVETLNNVEACFFVSNETKNIDKIYSAGFQSFIKKSGNLSPTD